MLQLVEPLYGLYVDKEQWRGQGLVEYALILGFIAILVIVAMIFFKDQLVNIYSRIGNSVSAT